MVINIFCKINLSLIAFLLFLSHQGYTRPLMAPKPNEKTIHNKYQDLRQRIADGDLSPAQLTSAVTALLEQLITIPEDKLLEPNKKRAISYVIATTRKFLKDYRLFRQDDEAAIMMRKRFIDELLRALRVSENLSENKKLVLEALEPLL